MQKLSRIIILSLLIAISSSVSAQAEEHNIGEIYYNYIYLYIANRNGGNTELADYITRAILNACAEYRVQPLLAVALFTQESNFNINAVSGTGAIGVAQIMPDTGSALGIDCYDVGQNIEGGVSYLATQLNNFAWAGEWAASYAIAAYNAGPNAVNSYGGIPPYEETVNHVNRIGEIYNELLVHAPREIIG